MADGTALIGDARNDENIAVNGIHAAFLCFHNKLLENGVARRLQARPPAGHVALAVDRAQRVPAADHRRAPRRRSCSRDPQLFKGCRTRSSRSSSRARRTASATARCARPTAMNFTGGPDGGQRFAFVFDASQIDAADPTDMQGGMPGAGRHIGWPTFFRFDDAARAAFTRPNKTIDTKLSTPAVPPAAEDGARPRGRARARAAQPAAPPDVEHPVRPEDRQEGRRSRCSPATTSPTSARSTSDFPKSTPLWFYVLREADRLGNGTRLGPLGGLIVGGVIVGLMQRDPNAYLNAAPGWKPTLGAGPGRFDDGRPARLRGRRRRPLGSARSFVSPGS